MKVVIAKFFPEDCCEVCNELIHAHFDCPVCGKKYASTSLYGEGLYDVRELKTDGFDCNNCKTHFVLLDNVEEDKYGQNLSWHRHPTTWAISPMDQKVTG